MLLSAPPSAAAAAAKLCKATLRGFAVTMSMRPADWSSVCTPCSTISAALPAGMVSFRDEGHRRVKEVHEETLL
jgi:hypothetical protein